MILFLLGCAQDKVSDPADDSSGDTASATIAAMFTDGKALEDSIYAPYGGCLNEWSYVYAGALVSTGTRSYDAAGYIIAYTYDDYADGTLDEAGVYTRDADELSLTMVLDTDGDGLDDASYSYTNGDGHILRVDATLSNSDTYTGTFTYDPEGYIELYTAQTGTHASGAEHMDYTWDLDGANPVQHSVHYAGRDDALEETVDITYNRYPFMVGYDWDGDSDGQLDTRDEYVYDAEQHVQSGTGTGWTDGVEDRTATYTWTYDADWRIASIATTAVSAGATTEYEFDYVYTCP